MNERVDCRCGDECGHWRIGRIANTTPHLEGADRHGKCYQLALNYVYGLPDDGVVLVHGTVSNGQQEIGHAWVVEADGWVWEPVNDAWIHSEDAFANSNLHGCPTERFQPSDATANAKAGEKIGVYNPVPPGRPSTGPDQDAATGG